MRVAMSEEPEWVRRKLGPDDQRAISLFCFIRTACIPVEEVQLGDILLDDGTIWRVIKIQADDSGPTFLDNANNKVSFWPGSTVTIIERECLSWPG